MSEDAPPPGSPPTARPRAWQGRQRGGRAGNLFFALLARSGRVGLACVPFFLFWVALYFVLAVPAARRASGELAERLGRGGGPLRRLLFAFRHFYGFGRLQIEKLAILAGNQHLFRFESHGRPALLAALAEGRGALLLTAHLGSTEIIAQILQGVAGRVTLVMFDGLQPELRATMERLAEGRAFRVLFSDGSPMAAAKVLRALGDGDLVGLAGDRVLAGKALRVPFLGGEVEFPAAPYALAATSRAPLVCAFGVRTGWRRYELHAFRLDPPRYTQRRERMAAFAACAQAYAARLEELLRCYPHQWGNFFSLWEAAGREEPPARS